jgi:hypothetical protein
MKRKLLISLVIANFLLVSIATIGLVMATNETPMTYSSDIDTTNEFNMDSSALTYYYTFVNPEPGDTVSGTETIQVYAHYDGYSLYRVRVALYKDGSRITSYVDMTSLGSGYWQVNWNTENYYDDDGYALRYVFYRNWYYYSTVFCDDLTVNNGGGGDTTAPNVDITSPNNGATVADTITIYASASDNVAVDRVEFYVDGDYLSSDSTSSYTANFNTEQVSNGQHTISAKAIDTSGNSDTDSITVNVDNDNPPPPPPPPEGEKIAVFFWASDAGTQNEVNKYSAILQDYGYTKFFNFRNSYDVSGDCAEIDSYETSEDTIFVYVFGHGNNNGQHSYTAFRPSGSYTYSNTFRGYMDQWEATKKFILTESCHSGDWADDFGGSGNYLAMSTSDETHVSYALGSLPGEGKFSYYFFGHVDNGYNAVDSFWYARGYTSNQYGKIVDNSPYTWF